AVPAARRALGAAERSAYCPIAGRARGDELRGDGGPAQDPGWDRALPPVACAPRIAPCDGWRDDVPRLSQPSAPTRRASRARGVNRATGSLILPCDPHGRIKAGLGEETAPGRPAPDGSRPASVCRRRARRGTPRRGARRGAARFRTAGRREALPGAAP